MLGLMVNLALGLGKLLGGILGQSFALIADAVNSLGDVLSTIVVLAALKIAQRPADAEHPYGHSRAEGIAATNVAVLIIVSGVLVGVEALQRWTLPSVIPPAWTLWIAGANIVVKESLYHYSHRIGVRTGSSSLIANAWDHRSDALCAFAVLVGLALLRFGGLKYDWADELASLIVAGAILFSGVQLFRSSATNLMDIQADPELLALIRDEAGGVEGVCEVETLWVRKSGLEFFADIHIEVDSQLTVEQGHRIGHQVKDRLLERFANLRDVLVHLEPHPHHH